MKLNRKTGLGMFFLIALTSLAVFTCKATGAGSGGSMDIADESTEPVAAPKLVSLAVRFASGNVNLVQDFSPDQTAYAVNLSAEDAGKSLKVTEAKAEEEADTLIKVGEDVVQTGSLISPPAGAAKVISVSVSRGALSTLYTVTILPPADYYSYSLASLQAVYTGTAVNQIQNFDAEVVNYSFNTDAAHANGSVNITAIPSSPAASLSIQVRGDSAFPNEHTVSVDLPPAGVYRYVDITVTSPESADPGQGGSRVYTVTILGYQPSTATWTAAVSGAPMTITAVTIFDSSPTQIAIAMQNKGGGSFEAATALNYNGKTFVVSMTDGALSYSTQAITPVISGSLGGNRSVSLDLNGVAYGRTISNATELYNLTLPENSAESWSVIADITLPSSPAWVGPSGFSGQFYGNGHTITLSLSQTSGQIGLFNSLLGGAGIYDLIVDVASSPASGITMTGSSYFGGVVGNVNGITSPILFENVKVKGELVYTTVTTFLVVGGFLGEALSNSASITFRNCISELNITENAPSSAVSGGGNLIGGFIGRGDSNTITFTNCYATGNILISLKSSTSMGSHGGGFMGYSGLSTSVIKMENCYSAGTVSGGEATPSTPMNVGGFVGTFASTQTTSHIQGCAALGLSIAATSSQTINIGRIMGIGQEGRLSNNFALSSMDVTKNGQGDTTVLSGTANNKNGLGKTADDFKLEATWDALNFDRSIWDFSTISQLGRPVLK